MTTAPTTIPRMGRRRKTVDQSTYSGMVAVRLRELREERDISVKRFAKRLKISEMAYYMYESNDRELPLDRIPAICKILGVPISEFFPE